MKAMNAAIEALNEIEAVWQEAYSFEFVDDVARKMAPRIFDHIRRHLKLRLEQYEIDVEQLRQAAAAGLEALVGIDTDEYGDPNNGPTGYREEREALQTVLAALHPEAITPQPTSVNAQYAAALARREGRLMTEPMPVKCANIDCVFNEDGWCNRAPDLGIELDELGVCDTFRKIEEAPDGDQR